MILHLDVAHVEDPTFRVYVIVHHEGDDKNRGGNVKPQPILLLRLQDIRDVHRLLQGLKLLHCLLPELLFEIVHLQEGDELINRDDLVYDP